MWLDVHGRSHSVSMEEPARVLEEGLRARILHFTSDETTKLLGQLNGYLPHLWEAMEGMQPAENELEFVDAEPPNEYRLALPVEGDIGEGILAQIDGVPLRWRSDVALAALQFLLFEKVPFEGNEAS